jgi:5-dehydro-2-deoxygluconokinase
VLCDDRYGQDALNEATGRGWWVGRPVELPGSNPLQFDRGRSVGTTLVGWPVEQVVKCLVHYHPDDPILHRLEQEAQIRALYDAVQASGHELLLEIIPPRHMTRDDDTVYRSVKRLYNLGIYPEWWKLEPMSASQWGTLDALIEERDPHCRGVLLLGLNAGLDMLSKAFRDARASRTCRGFAVGRTIFHEPAQAWLEGGIDDAQLKKRIRANYEALIGAWRKAKSCGLPPRKRSCATSRLCARRRRTGCSRCSRACLRSSGTATSRRSARRCTSTATSCPPTARTTNRAWRTLPSRMPRRTSAGA